MSDEELAVVWREAQKTPYPFGAIVQLLILTGQRRGEVTAMCWSQFNLADRVWTLPPSLTKNKREHNLPLPKPAVQILGSLPRLSDVLVFPAQGSNTNSFSGFSKCKKRLSDACDIEPWTLHDLRRTTATGLAKLQVQPHVIEKVLNHSSGSISGVAAIYNRFQYIDEMREALSLWAAHVLSLQQQNS